MSSKDTKHEKAERSRLFSPQLALVVCDIARQDLRHPFRPDMTFGHRPVGSLAEDALAVRL